MARRFLTPLVITQNLEYPDSGRYQLAKDLVYCTNIVSAKSIFAMVTITVPAQFISDGMTAPAIAWYLNKRGFACGFLHDYLYTSKYVMRSTADRILREACIDAGFSKLECWVIYQAVRLFGRRYYETN